MRRPSVARTEGSRPRWDYAARNPLQVPSLEFVLGKVVAEGALADAHQVGSLFLDAASAVESAGGVKKDAAEAMGISQRALSYYLAKHRVE